MKTKILSMAAASLCVLLLALSLCIGVPGAKAQPTEDDIKNSIEKGVAWLAGQQNPDGSWGEFDQVSLTAFAVLKLELHASQKGQDPFDPDYAYSEQIQKGLNYIFANTYVMPIADQPAGNPDADGDGLAVYMESPGPDPPHHRNYDTSISTMAIASSTHPDMVVNVIGSPVYGWTFEAVLQDLADYLAFGQQEEPPGQNDRGGWGYFENDDVGGDPLYPQHWTDNSNTGYVVLALIHAEASIPYGFDINIPAFVKDELSIWLDTIQDQPGGPDDFEDGGSRYNPDYLDYPWTWVNVLKTGNLLLELKFVGDGLSSPRVQNAIDYIERHWNDTTNAGWKGPGPGFYNYQAIYTIMKGFETWEIDEITVDSSSLDWYDEMATVFVNEQQSDGSWPACISGCWPEDDPAQQGCWEGGAILCTEWALLTLQKLLPPVETQTYVDIKPGSCPNPLNVKSKGVLPVAVLGTEDFDVREIDPATIKLSQEGSDEEVSPIRWSYEDVATPFTGDLCDCHTLRRDGHGDLTLKFKIQEIVNKLGLEHHLGMKIPLVLRGRLEDGNGGEKFEGRDCVRVQ